MKFAKIQGY